MAFDFYGLSDSLPATYCPVCHAIHYEATLFCAACYHARQAELRAHGFFGELADGVVTPGGCEATPFVGERAKTIGSGD